MKKVYVLLIFISTILVLGYLTFEKKVDYDKYAKVEVVQPICYNDTINLNSTNQCEFKLTNISNNPFYIIDISSSKKVNFLDTRIKKIIETNNSTIIKTEFIASKRGPYENKIFLESNSEEEIVLTIKGFVN